MDDSIFTYVLPMAIVVLGLILSVCTGILRDQSTKDKKPFSFGRAQLMWWTIIIASCYCSAYGLQDNPKPKQKQQEVNEQKQRKDAKEGKEHQETKMQKDAKEPKKETVATPSPILPLLPASCLILLGISLATTTAAKIIDKSDAARNLDRHQDQDNGVNFFKDILSDENGISVPRFQAVVFNIVYGLIFISVFVSPEHKFADFGQHELALMGISAAAYVGVKMNESKKKPEQTA